MSGCDNSITNIESSMKKKIKKSCMRAKHIQNLSLPLTSPVTLGSYNLSELWFPYFAKEGC